MSISVLALLSTSSGVHGLRAAPSSAHGISAVLNGAPTSDAFVAAQASHLQGTQVLGSGVGAEHEEAPGESSNASALQSINPTVPWAKQRADGCGGFGTGHCSHATLLMAAAHLNRQQFRSFVPECLDSVDGDPDDTCVRAAQIKLETRRYTGDLTTNACGNRMGLDLPLGTPVTDEDRRLCGCTMRPEVLQSIAANTFGIQQSSVLSIAQSRNEANPHAWIKSQLSAIVESGCVASVRVPIQGKVQRSAGIMDPDPSIAGHYMLLTGRIATQGALTHFTFNDPFTTNGEMQPRRQDKYTADSVAKALHTNMAMHHSPIAVYCPDTTHGSSLRNGQTPVVAELPISVGVSPTRP